MQGIKISQVGRIFASATPSDSRGRHNGRSRKTKEERRDMIVSFVERYKASNKGKFPPATLTQKEVGGTFYYVREILQELKQENISCDTLGTDLESIETKNQTRHTIQPLSLPAESANNGVVGNRHRLEHKEANYQEILSDTEKKKVVIHNDVLETCDMNNQTQANEEIRIVGRPLGSNPTSFAVDLHPLQGWTKGKYISSVKNGAINSNHHLELSEALSDTEEQGNITHNDVVKICYPNDQTQAKQEIKIGERPPRISAESVARDVNVLLQVIKGENSSGSIGVRDNNHSLALDEAEYLEVLSDTDEQKNIIQNDAMKTFGLNDQTQEKQEIKIVEKPRGANVASVVGVQPLQEMMEGQSISSVTGGFMDNNHILELNDTKYQEALSDTKERKNIIHNDVQTCGPNDQTQVKQEITIIERSPGTSAASNVMGLQPLHNVTKGQAFEKEEKNQLRSFKLDENQNNRSTHEKEIVFQISGTATNRNVIETVSSSVESSKSEVSEVKEQEDNPTHETDSSASISLDMCLPEVQSSSVTGGFMDNNHILELNDTEYQEALSDTEEQKNIIHNDVETCGPNDQTQVKQEITIIERSPGTSAASNIMGLQPLHNVTKGQAFEKEEKNQLRSFKLDENQNNRSTHEKEIVLQISGTTTNRNVIETDSSSVESSKSEVSEVKEQEDNPTHEMDSSASISLDTCLPEFQSSELSPHSLENQNMLGSLKELEHALPPVLEKGSMFGTQKITDPCSPLENNSSSREYLEEREEHLHLDTSKPLSLSSDSYSTTCVTTQPKDLSFSAQHEDDNNLVLNSTKRIADEPAIPADKIISPITDSVIAPQEATEIPDNILDDQRLATSNISPDQVLTGVKVHAGDASQRGSSEFQSENSEGYSFSKRCIDLSDKNETASTLSSSSLDQGGSIRDTVQSTQKTNSDGYCASNSEKKIRSYQGESTENMMQISHNFSDRNCTPTLENKNRTYENTESSKDREKLETMILGFVNNIVKGILYLLKK